MTAALSALLEKGGAGAPRPLYMAAEINPRAAEACLRTAKANKVCEEASGGDYVGVREGLYGGKRGLLRFVHSKRYLSFIKGQAAAELCKGASESEVL